MNFRWTNKVFSTKRIEIVLVLFIQFFLLYPLDNDYDGVNDDDDEGRIV